mmetsp:Transcript_3128/g.8890  ORF Transcript_3128/g.8890 Transcript_3128/m.8890 type:complete len:127 (-) Transcript_3128:753-1133(-)
MSSAVLHRDRNTHLDLRPSAKQESHRLHDLLQSQGSDTQGEVGDFFTLKLGLVEITAPSSAVRFKIFGGNPFWCSGLSIHHAALKKLRMRWECERLLWIAHRKEKSSGFHQLPEGVVRAIVALCSR